MAVDYHKVLETPEVDVVFICTRGAGRWSMGDTIITGDCYLV